MGKINPTVRNMTKCSFYSHTLLYYNVLLECKLEETLAEKVFRHKIICAFGRRLIYMTVTAEGIGRNTDKALLYSGVAVL